MTAVWKSNFGSTKILYHAIDEWGSKHSAGNRVEVPFLMLPL